METALVMAQEAQAAADVAHHHLIDDLGILEGRLGFEVTAAGLLTPEAIAFAEALIATLARRDAEVDKLAEQLRALSDVERKEVGLQTVVETVSVWILAYPLPICRFLWIPRQVFGNSSPISISRIIYGIPMSD